MHIIIIIIIIIIINIITTVDSRYLEVQATFWNNSRYPYLDISDLQNLGKNKTKSNISRICNLTEVGDILKLLWNRGEIRFSC